MNRPQKTINGFDLTLGGDAQFIPHLATSGWEGESGMTISLPDAKSHLASVKTAQDVITYEQADFSCKWYPRGQQGFEWEYILPKKPERNIISFDISFRNIIPYFQPPLTLAEIEEGCVRPEQTVGSYALYHPTGRWNQYRGGRFGRILRPKVISNNTKAVWADLLLDPRSGKMLITVPQDFLDSAEYPIIIDPTATFGSGDMDGDGSYSQFGASIMRGQKLTAPSDVATAVSFTFWARGSSSNKNVKAVLVLASSKTIVANGIGNIVTISTTAQSWISPFATPPALSPNTDYYICLIQSGTDIRFYYDAVTGTYFDDSSNSYTTPTDPTDGSEGSSRYYEIFCTYNQAAAGGAGGPLIGGKLINSRQLISGGSIVQ